MTNAKKTAQRRWVVKAGSQMVLEGGPLLLRSWMQQVLGLRERHRIDVVWVTSGAIAWASERTGFKNPRRTLPQKQALSAIGQPLIMDQYNLALQASGMLGSQVLLTAGDMRDRARRRNLQNVLNELRNWQVLPILNENDAVATDEIQFGDNDQLAAQVAVMIGAERLVLLTDVDGLFDADPKIKPSAQLIRSLSKVTTKELKMVGRGRSRVGTGGMYSKLLAGVRAQKSGIPTHLIKGDHPHGLLKLAEGQDVGTRIDAKLGKRGKKS